MTHSTNPLVRGIRQTEALSLLRFMNQIEATKERDVAIERGVAYLLKQQAADGGWHSQAYGQLKGGAAVTCLVLDTFSQLPAAAIKKQETPIDRGLQFLQGGLLKRRTIAAPDGSLDFPTYGCALLLTACARFATKVPITASKLELLREYLLLAQLREGRKFAQDHPSYGGWDFLGADDAQGITTGSNVSIVAHVLEGLVTDDSKGAAEARQAALGWLARCQTPDGGFAFTPEPMSLNNKAEFYDEVRAKPRSYGSATCDGIRALLAAGIKANEESVQKAATWLVKRPALEVVPGFEEVPVETDWRRGLRFYYYQSLARILQLLPAAERISRASDMERILLKDQQADGRWQNESDRMRENDPLIATCFALNALCLLS